MDNKQLILDKIFNLLEIGEFQDAFIKGLELVEKNPQDSESLACLAGIYEIKNDIVKALDFYLKAVKFDKNNEFANFKVGEHLYLLKKKNKELFEKNIEEWQKIAENNLIAMTTIRYLKNQEAEYNSEFVKILFDNFAFCFDSVLAKINYATPNKIVQKVQKLAKTQLKIIDFGCGTGLCGEKVRIYASRLVGTDISEKMIEKAKEKSVYDELICDDLLKIKVKDRFDLGICGDVLTYFPNIDTPLAKMQEFIEKKGYLLVSFSIPKKFTFKSVIQEENGRYLHSEKYIKFVAKKLGLKIVSKEKYIQRRELDSYTKGAMYLFKIK